MNYYDNDLKAETPNMHVATCPPMFLDDATIPSPKF